MMILLADTSIKELSWIWLNAIPMHKIEETYCVKKHIQTPVNEREQQWEP